MKTFFLIYILVLVSTHDSFSQQKLTLEECKELAKQNNYEIKKSALSIQEAQHGKKNAFTKYFPSVQANGIGLKSNSGLLETSIMGMDLSLIKEGFYGGISVTQPIFVGGQIMNGNKLANKLVDIQKNQSEIIADEVELLTEQYYWQYIQLKEKLKTLEIIEELVGQTLKEVSASVKAGLITHNNELQVQLKLDEVKASKMELHNNIDAVKMLLSQHIGIISDSIEITEVAFENAIHPNAFSVNSHAALHANKTYNLLDKGIEVSKYQTQIEKGKLLPTVAVGANYFFENMVDRKHTVGMAFVSVSIPISGWWGGTHSVRQKKINEKISEYNKIDAGEKIIVQIKNYYKELEVAYQQIQIAESSVKNALENLRLNNNYYKSGLITLNDLLDAQTLLQKAKDTLVDRYTGYLIKLSHYKKITGQ